MGEKSHFREYLTFWAGALVAFVGFNISLTASLLNLYRLNHSAQPILIMMLIEALVPIVSIKYLSEMFARWLPKNLFVLAAVLGVIGPLIQLADLNNLAVQYLGIAFCSAANSIQRPLMMQLAAFISDHEGHRMRINKLITSINYLGVLVGYFASGLLLTFASFEACFLVNAAAYAIFLILILYTRFPIHKVKKFASDAGFRLADLKLLVNRNSGLLTVYAMALALWLTGGSINVLEIPFAKKEMGASDGMVSMLFFATASGSILYSSLNWRLPQSLKSLPMLTVLAGISIATYVGFANFELSLPILLCFGFLTAIHNVQSMTQLQNLTAAEDLSDATIVLNTLNQAFGLVAASLGVLISAAFTERSVCLAFALATVLIASYYSFEKVKA